MRWTERRAGSSRSIGAAPSSTPGGNSTPTPSYSSPWRPSSTSRASRRSSPSRIKPLAFIDKNMRAQCEGYVAHLPWAGGHRRQNPHMHLLEGLLALWSVSSDNDISKEPGMSSTCSSGDSSSQRPERCASTSTMSCGRRAASTARSSSPAITTNGSGCCDGSRGRPASRCALCRRALCPRDGLWLRRRWPDRRRAAGGWKLQAAVSPPVADHRGNQGQFAEASLGRPGAEERAAALAERLATRFLQPATRGGWIDRLDKDGNRAVDHMPASTFYHIVCALHELEPFTTR